MLHAADDCSQTELHVVSFEGVKLLSVASVADDRYPAEAANAAAQKALSLRTPAAFSNARQALTRMTSITPSPSPRAAQVASATEAAAEPNASRVQTRQGGA
eukprot:5833965-Pleurochrysis_carterae.AAC.1